MPDPAPEPPSAESFDWAGLGESTEFIDEQQRVDGGPNGSLKKKSLRARSVRSAGRVVASVRR